ncbi:guanylate kinase [Moraxella sp. FZLJ2107]|uniref:guanylate kinase n=1 Tax=unclassified Moraxella TaxID=2685852 RepID=UPI00209C1C51|nr:MULTISPECIES: guanylate kinase [unclassified Moraxella]USZ14275.1 guanylate kinase [Moraxella sp. FZFQ2102]UTO04945.1 guanylate kinase [Moraxella sp. FZLJ2107]UTO21679.1 guanylate kinase [Moraxella sp. FZLJ2109]
MTGKLFIITAASGTGKTSLVKELLANTDNLTVSVSHTTRSPRPGEENGVHYHFVNKDEFETLISQSAFLEYAQVFDNYYGTSKQAVSDLLTKGMDVILEIDWQGALQVKEQFGDAVMIFILPPSRDALRSRLSNRGQDSDEVIEKRLAGSITEMRQYDKFDYVVINDDFADALSDLQTIIKSHRLSLAVQATRNQALIADLLAD